MLRGWGGQSNRILTEALAAHRCGHETALALPMGSELARRSREAGLQVHDEFSFRGLVQPISFHRDVKRLRRLLLSRDWDVLHLHGSPDTWAAAFALRGLPRRPAVIRTRHNIFPISRHPFNAWLYGSTIDGLIVISRAIEQQCSRIPFLVNKPTRLIWSVPDLGRFGMGNPEERRQIRERIRVELGASPAAPVVLCAGRLRPEKGQDILIHAAAHLVKHISNVEIWLAGDGSHRAEFQSLSRSLGLSETTVRFLGFRTDVPDLMAAADVAAVPSRTEGLGTAALEALACELPVVASNVGGLPDSVIPERTGILIPVGNSEALSGALSQLLNDPDHRARFGRDGRQLILEQFTESALAQRTLDFYQQMTTLRRP